MANGVNTKIGYEQALSYTGRPHLDNLLLKFLAVRKKKSWKTGLILDRTEAHRADAWSSLARGPFPNSKTHAR